MTKERTAQEEMQVAVQPKTTIAPDAWGSREEVKEIADRLKRFVPGTKKMNGTEIMAFAQLVHMTGLNPCASELHGWDSKGDGSGVLITKLHYGILVRWAMSQEPFATRFTTEMDESENIISRCRLLRQSDRPLLGQLLSNGVDYQEALAWATTEGLGIVTKKERWSKKYKRWIDPPKSKSWPWKAEKRALEDAIKRAYGSPSTKELARQSWIVEGVVTIPSDWADVTPEMLPNEREAQARLTALRREREHKPTGTFEENVELLFGPAFPDEPPRVVEITADGITAGTTSFEEPTETTAREVPGDSIARPAADAETAKGWLTEKAKKPNHYLDWPTPGQVGLMNGLLSKILGGDKERRSWLAWTWGNPSSKKMTGGQVGATLDWLKPVKDPETGQHIPLDIAVQECKLMLRRVLLDAGQQEFEMPTDMADEKADS